MNILKRNIDIAFSEASPEYILQNIKSFNNLSANQRDSYLNSRSISREYYNMISRGIDKDYSYEEIMCMYDEICGQSKAYCHIPSSLFQLLIGYSDSVLRLENGVPVCRKEKTIDWRSVTLQHGQDLFTCSYLAYLTVIGKIPIQSSFDWPAIIETDDKRLKTILSKGIAENHFHLVGSTRVFSLSWVALMNSPEKINHFYRCIYSKKEVFTENRSRRISYLNNDNRLSWNNQLLYAGWIRSKLFQLIYGCNDFDILRDFFAFELKLEKSSDLIAEIKALQYQYGRLFLLPSDKNVVLDYAICDIGSPIDVGSPNRLLFGERELLYRLFISVFRGELKSYELDLFYAYLLLKNRFRAEIIQVNREVGFANFSLYQDRKDTFWQDIPKYWYEAQRLAVNSTFESGRVRLLEMRLQPKASFKSNYDLLLEEDQIVLFNDDKNMFQKRKLSLYNQSELERMSVGKELPFFYVMHFIKKKDKMPLIPMPFGIVPPKNCIARYNASKRALAIAYAMNKSSYLCTRIRGIDAASFEIGCRPESFATEFRFLTNFIPEKPMISALLEKEFYVSKLGITYHAGEDFLDIIDGLRAIDEAVAFLGLKRGDRLGHALALGVDPKVHYAKKHNLVTICKHDMLDNYVWILNRSKELDISFDYSLRILIQDEAERLLEYIYGDCIRRHGWKISLEDYYASWKLRADNPLCYYFMRYENPYAEQIKFMATNSISYKYFNSFKSSDTYDMYRNKDKICGLLYYYHYGYKERLRGLETCSIQINVAYINLVRQFQDKIQRLLSEKGVSIECNPSSNELIGTFQGYENHPVFRFNRHIIGKELGKYNIEVSINTDDQGVFDTSLENEYALLVGCMSKMEDDCFQRKYSDETIYDYINHLRSMSLQHSFSEDFYDIIN